MICIQCVTGIFEKEGFSSFCCVLRCSVPKANNLPVTKKRLHCKRALSLFIILFLLLPVGLLGFSGCGLEVDEIVEGITSDDVSEDITADNSEDVVEDQQKGTAVDESEMIADEKPENVVNDEQENEADHVSVDEIITNDVTELSHGEVTSYDNWVYEVLTVEFHEEIHRVGSPARASGKFVVALVRIKNVADAERQLGASFFAAEDEIGITYSMRGLVAYDYQRAHGLQHSHSDTIEPDAYATVPLVFDVPKDLEKLTIIPPDIKASDLNGTSPIVLYDHR